MQFLLVTGFALAQTPTGTIVGTLTDSTGAAVTGASIHVIDEETGFARETVLDAVGAFRLPDIPVGVYGISVEVQGFKKYRQSGVVVAVNRNLTLNAVLEVGSLSETVTVTTAPTQVDTISGFLANVVGQREARELPLNGRNVLQLMTLNPGLGSAQTYHSGLSSGGTTNPSYAVNGTRGDQVNFMLDGASNNDDLNNLANYYPNPDAVQEFSVLANSFSAEYGTGAGGVVNAVSRSGTNQLHGTAFEFVRNTAMNAADFFSHQVDTLKRNQYGGTIGGPVFIPHVYDGRDKTFFFYSYQNTPYRFAPTNKTAIVPTMAERTGDFSQSALGKPLDPTTNQRFPGDIIPQNRFDPVMTRMLNALLPFPNAGGNLLRFASASTQNQWEHLFKLDHSFSSRDKLSARIFITDLANPPVPPPPEADGTLEILAAASGTLQRATNVVVSESHIFGPSLVNNWTFNFNRLSNNLAAPYTAKSFCDFGRQMYCFPGGIRLTTPQFAFPAETDQYTPRESFRIADGANWIRGRHNLKFGLDIRQVRADYISDSVINGSPSITGQFTGNAFADLVLGLEASDSRAYYVAINPRGFFQSYYVQDDIRVSSRLTLNVGVRWDPYQPWIDKWDKLSIFLPAGYAANMHSKRFPNAPAGLFWPGDPLPGGGTLSRSTINSDFKLFAPRFGFAYSPLKDSRLSIRGGYGIFYDQQVEPILVQRQANGAPFNVGIGVNGVQFANPFAAVGDPIYTLKLPPGPDSVFNLPIGPTVFNPNFLPSYIQQWNFTVEEQLMKDLLLRVSYVGTKGTRLISTRALNPAIYTPGNSTLANTNARRMFAPQYSRIGYNNSDALSIYHALQWTLERRFAHGVQFNINYAWSHAIDEGSSTLQGADCCGSDIPQNPLNLRADRASTAFDIRHRFVASGIWDIPGPAWNNPASKFLLRGWEFTPILNIRTGSPINIITGQDRSFSANNFDRPDVIGDPVLSNGRSKQQQIAEYFNPAVFVLSQIGQFGDLGRNALYGPGSINLDAGLFKNFRFRESGNVQFRWEMFNAFNHTNLGNPVATVGVSLGRILSDAGARIMQLGVKLQF
jgi:hypothetical protein